MKTKSYRCVSKLGIAKFLQVKVQSVKQEIIRSMFPTEAGQVCILHTASDDHVILAKFNAW